MPEQVSHEEFVEALRPLLALADTASDSAYEVLATRDRITITDTPRDGESADSTYGDGEFVVATVTRVVEVLG